MKINPYIAGVPHEPDWKQRVEQFEDGIGRKVDGLHWFTSFETPDSWQMSKVREVCEFRGHAYVSLNKPSWPTASPTLTEGLVQVGGYWRQVWRLWRELGGPDTLTLRPFAEFTISGVWPGSPARYRGLMRMVKDAFWCPNVRYPGDRGPYKQWWPGAGMVAHAGFDFYVREQPGGVSPQFIQASLSIGEISSKIPSLWLGEVGVENNEQQAACWESILYNWEYACHTISPFLEDKAHLGGDERDWTWTPESYDVWRQAIKKGAI